MTYDEDSVRRLFADEPLPPGIEEWRGPVARPEPVRGAPSRRWVPVLATAAVVLVLVVGVALLRPFTHGTPDARTGATASATPGRSGTPSATAGAEPSAAPSNGASTSTRPPGTSAPAPTWPGAGTTGVPAGTTLRNQAGDLRVTRAGEVVSDLVVTGSISVEAPDVTIRRVRVVPSAKAFWGIRQLAPRLRIEDVEIAGDAGAPAEIGVRQEAAGLTVRRLDAHGVETALSLGSGADVADSWLHDLAGAGTVYGVVVRGGAAGVTVRHSTIANPTTRGAAVAVFADDGPNTDVTVTGNLFGGGDYTVHCGEPGASARIRFVDNRFIRGARGAVRGLSPLPPAYEWRDNRWQDGGTVPPS